MPVAHIHEEVTQPRVKNPARPRGPATAPVDAHEAAQASVPGDVLVKANSKQTLTLEDYDPERLKKILAQAQAQAGTRPPRRGSYTVPIVIAAIVAVTFIGVALVIALLS
jgi:hypothetical protein